MEDFKNRKCFREGIVMESEAELLEEGERMKALHERALGQWKEGAISKVWRDEEGNLLVKYRSGVIYTYAQVIDFATEEVVDWEFW